MYKVKLWNLVITFYVSFFVLYHCIYCLINDFLQLDMDEEVEDLTTEIEQNENVVDGVKEPMVGMIFDSIDDVVEFYKNHSGKPRTRGMKVNQLHPQTKADCKAKIMTVILADGKWKLSSFVLDHNHAEKLQARRFDKMCNAFYEVANMASEFEDCCEKVMDGVEKLKLFMKEEISGTVKCVGTHNCPTPKEDGTGILKESTNILDPLVTRSKGRPPSKRKQSTVEKIHVASPMGTFGLGTQESINLSHDSHRHVQSTSLPIGTLGMETLENINPETYGLVHPTTCHGGGGSYNYQGEGEMGLNPVAYPPITGIRPYFGQPNMTAYPNTHWSRILPLQVYICK
ncbi:hypothetical protein RHMOL_Rhmol03G0219100 [Rhododendron molle]|uniref:Uncharacterized protein n=1 Tax=Rhododendron molle TaxID=49168 RepID=A0ACC0PGX0_RHOML|nr:hypothetical protein RHMOL_Rhmol03G0219100 [Rhododendron molle]